MSTGGRKYSQPRSSRVRSSRASRARLSPSPPPFGRLPRRLVHFHMKSFATLKTRFETEAQGNSTIYLSLAKNIAIINKLRYFVDLHTLKQLLPFAFNREA